MFKSKIAHKLAAVFVVFVILCVSILGVLFINIFASNHIEFRTESLIKAAKQISYMDEVSQMDEGKLQLDNRLIEFLDYSADARIWIVNKNMDIVVRSNGDLYEHEEMNCLLPQNDVNFMNEVLSGKDMTSYDNIAFYDVPMLSVGVPIYKDGDIVGAVLLHTSVKSLGASIRRTAWYLALAILFSIFIIIVAVSFYAVSFTRPLKRMKDIAGEMIDGNYSVKTNISQKDEIGELAHSMDILASRLEQARIETEKLEQIRRDFVANVSHEFRTPLTVIKGNLETLIDTKVDDPKAYYESILSEVNALEKLVGDLLDLSRIESGKMEFNIEEVDVRSLLSDVARSIAPIATHKCITIDLNRVAQFIPPIYSDYFRLRQVLIIFLTNAVKYSDHNKKVTICADVADALKITIKDQGRGISDEDLPYIWDRFYKADKMRTDGTSTGLGLSIAKNLLTALGGDVIIQSEINVGSTIEITMPLGKEGK